MTVPPISEAQLNREIQRLARMYDIRAVHITDSRTHIGAAGLPDWILLGTEVLWRELKSAYGDLETDQRHWRDRLKMASQDWAVWRPVDLESGRIAQEMQAIAPPWVRP